MAVTDFIWGVPMPLLVLLRNWRGDERFDPASGWQHTDGVPLTALRFPA